MPTHSAPEAQLQADDEAAATNSCERQPHRTKYARNPGEGPQGQSTEGRERREAGLTAKP